MHPAKTTGFGYMGYKLGTRNTIGSASVTSVMRTKKGLNLVGTDKDGLYCVSQDGKVLKHFKESFPSTILSISEDQQGRIWVGSFKEGCGWIDASSLTYHPYPLPQGNKLSIFDLEADRQGYIWLGTMGNGLLRIQPDKHEMKAYTAAEDADKNRKINSIANNYISQISLSPDGKRIYIATSMGVCAMDIATENWLSTFNNNCLNYGTPTRIAREFGGQLYVGTNDGLTCYNLKTHKTHLHTVESGLGNNGISSLEQDDQGRLWISTTLRVRKPITITWTTDYRVTSSVTEPPGKHLTAPSYSVD